MIGLNQISLEEMIRKLEGAFIQIHNISKVEYCPTLEMTVQQCKMLLLIYESSPLKKFDSYRML